MTDLPVEDAPTLRADETVARGLPTLVGSGLPALPVVDADGELVGLFGEREFMAALFPGYVGELHYAGFVLPNSMKPWRSGRRALRNRSHRT